jgi:plasmid stabilization system protein ParE
MKHRLVLRRVAEREFDDSIAWYEREREGLGREFQAAVGQYLQRIANHPEWFPKVRGEVRRAVVRRFPFVIHFLVETNGVVILAIFHTSRAPGQLSYRR